MNGIRFANESDRKSIQTFINDHWKEDHILAISDDVFDWLYLRNGKINFVISEVDSEVSGILGFIESKGFDEGVNGNTLWLALWKVNEDLALPATGIRLLKYLELNKDFDAIGTLGITPVAEKIYQALGYRVGTLDHYFIGNPNVMRGVISSGIFPYDDLGANENIVEELDCLPLGGWVSSQFPSKSLIYLKNKYESSPFYRYKYLTFGTGNKKILLIGKVVTYGGSQALRIVDLFGEISLLKDIAPSLQVYIEQCDYEFVDLLLGCLHLDLACYGFGKISEESTLCIPQYYDPFVQKNSSIGFAFKCDNATDFVLVKGDADQDRPNRIFWED